MPFIEATTISNDPTEPMPGMTGARWLKGLDSNVFEAVLEAMSAEGETPSPFVFIEIRHAGGAISRPVPGASYSSRTADRLLEAVAPVFDPAAPPGITARLERLWDRLGPNLADGAYLNFLEGKDRVVATRQAFDSATFRRLAETKRRYNPTNVFGHGLDLTD